MEVIFVGPEFVPNMIQKGGSEGLVFSREHGWIRCFS